MLSELAGQHVLMLQGPAGPFFARVARRLRRQGCTVTKVNFNAGEDLYFRGPDVIPYRGPPEAWRGFFQRLIRERNIDAIMLFGDCRPVHRAAIEEATKSGRGVYVFEEGYLRPDYVTLERGGVNGYSSIPRDPEFYRALTPASLPPTRSVRHAFAAAMAHTIVYAVGAAVLGHRYPEYVHHRDIRPLRQAGLWLRGGVRRALHTVRDRRVDRMLIDRTMPPYYFVPLQVHLDSQLRHSEFASNEAFIAHVVESFARAAPRETILLLKHHPFDRAYRDYSDLIAELGNLHGVTERLWYVDVISIPDALDGARGTVVLNSTVGLSSIHHGTPVKCLGKAIYDMPGLTSQRPLDEFWQEPGSVDKDLYLRFRWWLCTHVQINGCVWLDLYADDVAEAGASEATRTPSPDVCKRSA